METTLSTNTKVIIIMAVVAAAACLLAVKFAAVNGAQVARPFDSSHAVAPQVAHWEIPHAVSQLASMPFDSSH